MNLKDVLDKLGSRKLWVTVFSLLGLYNQDIVPAEAADEMVTSLNSLVAAAISVVYIVSQAFVDAAEKKAPPDNQ